MRYYRTKRYFPPLVSGVILLKHPPWIKYLYVQSYDELDALLTREAGEDWKQQPWAKYWMRSYWSEQKQRAREAKRRYHPVKKEMPAKQRLQLPQDMLLSLIESHSTLSNRSLLRLLRRQYGISLSYYTLKKLLSLIRKGRKTYDSTS